MPGFMGGSGSFDEGFKDLPFLWIDEAVLNYGLFSFGLRIESIFSLIFLSEWGADFEEMLLHDSLTFFLFYGYLFSNFLPVGTMIIILHDIADIPFHLSKALHAAGYNDAAVYPFVFGLATWLYFRLYCLPRIIWNITYQAYPPERAHFDPFIWLSVVFLSMLYCMHWLWFYMMLRIA